ncbi:ATP-binding cassette domain-containing protein [Mobilitalea sibirica]|uniref:ATP-binding cassette domain-containing protein n=1 Tax=Mobilitalea sibirica TaxID=1462919 RepID=A0A8J7L247_9FIRM|nr:ATP-binding cassette domain-containing protein [Mobilitalea sibirica]MBH1939938.1 ATP-binding cassette domain-containing protein [Mobilitalea sibirica]
MGLKETIASLSNGFDTHLSKEFDINGTLLSGGEAQKVCIARVLNKETGLYIFDEPSSALDPVSEYRMNIVMKSATDKTVIIISHRLSTTVMADRIIMFKELVEQGIIMN